MPIEKPPQLTDEERQLIIAAAKQSPDVLDRNIGESSLVTMTSAGEADQVQVQKKSLAQLLKRLAVIEGNKERRGALLGIAERYEPSAVLKLSKKNQRKLAEYFQHERIHGAASRAEYDYGAPKGPAIEKGKPVVRGVETADKRRKEQEEKSVAALREYAKAHPGVTPRVRDVARAAAQRRAVTLKPAPKTPPRRRQVAFKLPTTIRAVKKNLPRLRTGNVKLTVPKLPSSQLPRTARLRTHLGR